MIILTLSFIFLLILFVGCQIKQTRLSNNEGKNYIYFSLLVLSIGCLVRVLYLTYPYGIFPDEAIAGYDSWCLANYGVDQHLFSYPVYLKSWGTGQSAAYSLLAMPFVKVFGLSIEVFRFPMALMSSLALLIFYWALNKTQENKLLVFALTLFFAILPWHVMMSRWALDCNLYPNFLLIGVSLIFVGAYIKRSKKQLIYYLLGFMSVSVSAYCYGVSWIMLPFFCIGIFFYLYKTKRLCLKYALITGIISLIVTLPIILFAFNLFSGGEPYQLGIITIPQLAEARHNHTSIMGAANPLLESARFLYHGAQLTLLGHDNLPWNAISYWGQFYNILAIPFVLIAFGFLFKSRKRTILDAIFLVWLLSSIPIMCIVSPNTNHWNAIWFPLAYFTVRGVLIVIERYKQLAKPILALSCLLFVGFSAHYCISYNDRQSDINQGFIETREPIDLITTLDVDEAFYPFHYVYLAFHHPISPYILQKKPFKPHYNWRPYAGESAKEELKKLTIIRREAHVIANDCVQYLKQQDAEVQKKEGSVYTVYWKN